MKYLLTINENKYPEVVARLEKAKEKDGIALYIRQLVEKDIQQKLSNIQTITHNEIAATIEPRKAHVVEVQPEIIQSEEKVKSDEVFDGLA